MHPHLAAVSENAPTEADVKAARQDWERARKAAEEASKEAGIQHGMVDGAEKSLLTLLAELMDGVSLAKKIRKDNESVQIVFITGFADYISEGYEVSALHYLMKPVKKEKLFAVLDRAVAALQKSERAILLPLGGEMLRLPVEQVLYVEAFSHSVAVVTSEDTIQVKMPISELETLLGDGFIRCHRSYLVGIKNIARLSKTEVILDNGKALPLSRTAAPLVHKAFISYYTGDNHETV